MAQDLRELFKNSGEQRQPMKKGHRDRFLQRLEAHLPRNKKNHRLHWAVAAGVLALVGLGIHHFVTDYDGAVVDTVIVDKPNVVPENPGISLGDLSPDLKKVEDYYVVNINMELSRLEFSGKNKVVVDSYLKQLGTLGVEYKKLNEELNDMGPNDHTILALIKNLQLRLQLLYTLKEKLNELKSSENETDTSNAI